MKIGLNSWKGPLENDLSNRHFNPTNGTFSTSCSVPVTCCWTPLLEHRPLETVARLCINLIDFVECCRHWERQRGTDTERERERENKWHSACIDCTYTSANSRWHTTSSPGCRARIIIMLMAFYEQQSHSQSINLSIYQSMSLLKRKPLVTSLWQCSHMSAVIALSTVDSPNVFLEMFVTETCRSPQPRKKRLRYDEMPPYQLNDSHVEGWPPNGNSMAANNPVYHAKHAGLPQV